MEYRIGHPLQGHQFTEGTLHYHLINQEDRPTAASR